MWYEDPSPAPPPLLPAASIDPSTSECGLPRPLGGERRREHLEEPFELRVAHRRREAAEAGGRDQHAVVEEEAHDPVEARGLRRLLSAAPVVRQRPVARVHA